MNPHVNREHRRTSKDMSYRVYVARTCSGKLYVGHTTDLRRREGEHRSSRFGAKFIRDSGSSFRVVYTEDFLTRAEATRRERQLKGWTRAKKEALIAGNLDLLKKL